MIRIAILENEKALADALAFKLLRIHFESGEKLKVGSIDIYG